MLAKARHEGECEEGSNQHAQRSRQQIPVAGRAFVGHAALEQANGPPADGGQPDDVQDRGNRHHADDERPHRHAVAEGERSATRARRRELEGDDGGGDRQDEGRPGDVRQERASQRAASSELRAAASAASRRVMRRNSK